jgi:hypothetical protein
MITGSSDRSHRLCSLSSRHRRHASSSLKAISKPEMLPARWRVLTLALWLALCLSSATAQACPPQSVAIGIGSTMCLCNPGYYDTTPATPCAAKTPCPQQKQVTALQQNSFANVSLVGISGSQVCARSTLRELVYPPALYDPSCWDHP